MTTASKIAALALIAGFFGTMASGAIAAETKDTTWQKITRTVNRSTIA